jgi:glycerol-3-phosphate dehydrogenase
MVQREWARTAADVLWRRSKLGLRMTSPQARALAGFLRQMAMPQRPRSERE